MASILREYRLSIGDPELPTVEQMDTSYANLRHCDPAEDIVIIENGNRDPIGYARASWEDDDESRSCVIFFPTRVADRTEELFRAVADAMETHTLSWAVDQSIARYRAFAAHPGAGLPAIGEAAWFESRGYTAEHWEASLVRPNLDNIPDRKLPDGVDLRAARPENIRQILVTHFEAFRGDWDFQEPVESDYQAAIDDPLRDESLWKIAWVGDDVVGQVKSYINAAENAETGALRGYTEEISTHADWRNKGIAGALLAMSLVELRDCGMTEAALGVDTNNPGGAFQLYTELGFELQSYTAVYEKAIESTDRTPPTRSASDA
jgi:mycothiol synthase